MIPERLKEGDTVAVIAPARSLAIIQDRETTLAIRRLKELGLNVIFSKHAEESDEFGSSKIRSRIEDIHWAFGNKKVKAILTAIGGFNSNQLLGYLDFKLIKRNPKILCGFSDITALQCDIRQNRPCYILRAAFFDVWHGKRPRLHLRLFSQGPVLIQTIWCRTIRSVE